MATCWFCGSEMASGQSCTVDALHVGGRRYALRPYRPGPRQRGTGADRCGDCGVARGGFHHPGCDLQRCPRCRRQLLSCGCRFDEDGHLPGEPMGVDGNGCPVERLSLGGTEVVVHHADVPASDITEVHGIRCTTALRTLIDVACELPLVEVRAMAGDFLRRGLFTVDEAWARLDQPDMQTHRGADVVRRLLPAR